MKRKIKFIFLATTMVVASGTYCAFGAEQQETSAVQVIVENTQEATSPLETQGNGMTKNGVAGSVKATTEKEDKNITTVSLTLDEAVQKAIANSTSLKKLEADMDLADDDREKIYDAYAYSTSDDNLSSLLQLSLIHIFKQNGFISSNMNAFHHCPTYSRLYRFTHKTE